MAKAEKKALVPVNRVVAVAADGVTTATADPILGRKSSRPPRNQTFRGGRFVTRNILSKGHKSRFALILRLDLSPFQELLTLKGCESRAPHRQSVQLGWSLRPAVILGPGMQPETLPPFILRRRTRSSPDRSFGSVRSEENPQTSSQDQAGKAAPRS